jgi:hypothetical protein
MPNYNGLFQDSESGLSKLFKNPELENVSQHAELTSPTGVEDIPAVKTATPPEIHEQAETSPEKPSEGLKDTLKADVSPHQEVGTHDYSEPAINPGPKDYVHPNAETSTDAIPNFDLGKGESTYTGRSKPGTELARVPEVMEELPSPLKPETAEDIKTVLSSKTPEERKNWFTTFKENPKKALAAIGIGGLVAANQFGGNSDNPSAPGVKPLNKAIASKKEEPDTDEEESEQTSGKKSSGSNPNSTELPANMASLLNRGGPQSTYQDQLADANRRRDSAILAGQLAKAGTQIGASIARVKPQDTSVADTAIAQAGQIPKDLEAQWATLEKDPNSQYSKDLRATIKRATGYDIPESASAANIKDSGLFKELTSLKETQEKTQLRKVAQQEANNHRDELAADKKQKADDSNNFKVSSAIQTLRGDKALQADKDTIRKVQNTMGLIKSFKDPNDIPARLVTDMNTQLAGIMQGGQAGEGLIKEVSAHPFIERASRFLENVGDKPTGAQMGEFVKQNAGIINDFANQAQNRYDDRNRKIMNTIGKKLNSNDRENFRSQILPSDTMDQNGNFGGMTKIKDPQGNIRLVPFNQVKAATSKEAGGEIVKD